MGYLNKASSMHAWSRDLNDYCPTFIYVANFQMFECVLFEDCFFFPNDINWYDKNILLIMSIFHWLYGQGHAEDLKDKK